MTDEFIQTIKSGDFSKFKEMLHENPNLGESFDDELQATAILVAVYYGRKEFVEQLMALNISLNIWEAAATGSREKVTQLLLDDPEDVYRYSKDGYTALGLAAFFGYPEVMEILIAHGAEVNMRSKHSSGVSAINAAAAHPDAKVSLKMLNMLIEFGADVNAAQHGGITALHTAANHGHLEKAEALLEAGADRNLKADDGRTALQMAQEGGHEALISLLDEG